MNILVMILIICGCTSDYTKRIGKGYTYRDEGGLIKDIFHEFPEKGGEIPATVVSFDFDRNFIIAKQKPKIPQDPLYIKEYIYETPDAYYYWLILKKKQLVLGPYRLDEFERVKQQYNVSEKLKLE